MTYPVNPITISYSYSDFQLGQGNNAFPGTQIDTDFATLTNSINSLNTFVRGITRSDGKLANQSVGVDQLAASLNLGFTLQGPWVSGFAYSTADGVIYNGNFYRALFAHTSAAGTRPDLSPATWQFLFSTGSVVGAMTAAVYDPQNKIADTFARANHTGTQAISTVSGLQPALDAKADTTSVDAKVVYTSKNGSYTALTTDNNVVHRYTVAATVALTAAATLGNSWHYTVVADGGAVTIDPNAAETINGFATLVVPNGSTATIICDGTSFFTVIRSSSWETVGLFTFSAVASLIVTDQGASRFIRISGYISQSALGIIFAQFSANNGVSYDTAANYFAQSITGAGTVAGAQAQAATTGMLLTDSFGSDAASNTPIKADFYEFNQATQTSGFSEAIGLFSATRKASRVSAFHSVSAAQNAFKISNSGGGTLSGTILVERMRG